jgi:hypothetical protein
MLMRLSEVRDKREIQPQRERERRERVLSTHFAALTLMCFSKPPHLRKSHAHPPTGSVPSEAWTCGLRQVDSDTLS